MTGLISPATPFAKVWSARKSCSLSPSCLCSILRSLNHASSRRLLYALSAVRNPLETDTGYEAAGWPSRQPLQLPQVQSRVGLHSGMDLPRDRGHAVRGPRSPARDPDAARPATDPDDSACGNERRTASPSLRATCRHASCHASRQRCSTSRTEPLWSSTAAPSCLELGTRRSGAHANDIQPIAASIGNNRQPDDQRSNTDVGCPAFSFRDVLASVQISRGALP